VLLNAPIVFFLAVGDILRYRPFTSLKLSASRTANVSSEKSETVAYTYHKDPASPRTSPSRDPRGPPLTRHYFPQTGFSGRVLPTVSFLWTFIRLSELQNLRQGDPVVPSVQVGWRTAGRSNSIVRLENLLFLKEEYSF